MTLILTIIAAFVPLLQSLVGTSNVNLIQTVVLTPRRADCLMG